MRPPEVPASFTTMTETINPRGHSTSCPSWFWERWGLSVSSDVVKVEVPTDTVSLIHLMLFYRLRSILQS